MRIVYGEGKRSKQGKRSKHSFMPFAEVYYTRFAFVSNEYLRSHERSNTLKAILRCVGKQKCASSTVLKVPSRRVGYADIYIIM